MEGWIKLHRKLIENPIVCKDGDTLAIWIYLLMSATHKKIDAIFKGERITLKEGQLITGRKSISEKLDISESKVQRVLKLFENEHQIEQQTSSQNRLISIVNWNKYQDSEQQSEQQVNNERTTSEQRVNTNKNERIKECKNERIIKKEIKKETKQSFDSLIDSYTENEILRTELKNHLAVRKQKKGALTNRAIELELKKLDNLTSNDFEKIDIVQQSIERGWTGFFPLKEKRKESDEEHLERLKKMIEEDNSGT